MTSATASSGCGTDGSGAGWAGSLMLITTQVAWNGLELRITSLYLVHQTVWSILPTNHSQPTNPFKTSRSASLQTVHPDQCQVPESRFRVTGPHRSPARCRRGP